MPSKKTRDPNNPGAALGAIMQREFAAACKALSGAPRRLHTGVHGARKHLRRLRALIELGGRDLGPAGASMALSLRSVARRLSALRDAQAEVDVAHRLLADHGDAGSRRASRHALAALEAARDAVAAAPESTPREIDALRDVLADLADLATTLPWARIDAATLDRALRRGARKADARRKRVRRRASTERWHDWRKAVRRVRFALQVIEALPAPLRDASGLARASADKAARDIAKLSDRLGELLDLTRLRAHLRDMPDRDATRALRRLAARRAAHRGRQLSALLARGGGALSR